MIADVERRKPELLTAGKGQHALGQRRAAPRALKRVVDQPRNFRVVSGAIALCKSSRLP